MPVQELIVPDVLERMETDRRARDAKQQERQKLATLRTGDSADCPHCHNRARVVEIFPTTLILNCGCRVWREQS